MTITDMYRLDGTVAIVTGASSGLGVAFAQALAEAGADVVLGARRVDRLEATAQLVREAGRRVLAVATDVADPAQCQALVDAAVAEFGRVDILVNNAGIQHVAPVDEFPPERWDAILAINLSSAFHATRAALPGMKKRGWGRVINVASIHGLVASPFKSAYVAAKHGVIGLTKTVALEVAELGITVNAICPGYVWTPIVEKQLDDQVRVHGIPKEKVIADIMLAPQPTKRFIRIEEVAQVALNLADEAAGQINGAAMVIDGGWTAR